MYKDGDNVEMATKKSTDKSTAELVREEIRDSAQRTSRRARRHSTTSAEYGDVDASKLLAAISAIAASGCAVQFGYTKDGSAYVVRIVGDGDPYNEFIRPSEDFELYLQGVIEDFSK